MKDVVKKSFYLTSLFADIKSEHNWTTNEIKTVMLMFSKMSKYKIYEKRLVNKKSIEEALSKVPSKYIITKKEFIEVTDTRLDNASREINKVRKKLISKIINTPHPFEEEVESGESISWFSKITYSSVKGELEMELNRYALERLIAFIKYSKISFENLVKLKNSYSIFTYLFIKIIKDISFNQNLKTQTLEISEFKEKLSLKNKYKDINLFRIRVLDIVKKEINENTDFDFDYSLKKGESGKALKYIVLNFDYKKEYINNDSSEEALSEENYAVSEDSIFETVLTSWGIRARKIIELEDNYSINSIIQAIDITKLAIKEKTIKTTPAAFFIGTLENKQLQEEVAFEQVQETLRKEQEEQEKKELASEYDAIQKFINDNDEVLSKYLSAKSLGTEYPLDSSLKEEVANLSCVGADKFKDFRPKLAVLERGYFDSSRGNIVRPNMYTFLSLIENSFSK